MFMYRPLVLQQTLASSSASCLVSVRTKNNFLPSSIYWREILPLTLRNRVSNVARDKIGGAVCNSELTAFLTCLRKSDYEDSHCVVEHAAYMKCIETEMASRKQLMQMQQEGNLGTEGRQVSTRQVNTLLQMHPQKTATMGKQKRYMPHMSYQETFDLYRPDLRLLESKKEKKKTAKSKRK